MKQSLIERILFKWCDWFGHKALAKNDHSWEFNGHLNYDCPRCGRIISKEIKKD